MKITKLIVLFGRKKSRRTRLRWLYFFRREIEQSRVPRHLTILCSLFIMIAAGLVLTSCQETSTKLPVSDTITTIWNLDSLGNRAVRNLDSSRWDLKLFKQDIETYRSYSEVFQSFPLNKSPFPVATYDYAVSSTPFIIEYEDALFKGVRIGEYESPEGDAVRDRLTLLVLTNDKDALENTLVESRNYPYLTAQGVFETRGNEFDWVFSASPDGFSTLILNMKLFDLRFGETILIYPQEDKSFFYDQIKDSPNNYKKFEDFENALMNYPKVKARVISEIEKL